MWTKVEDRIWQDENVLYHSNGADGQTWVAWDIETALGGGVIWLVHQQYYCGEKR